MGGLACDTLDRRIPTIHDDSSKDERFKNDPLVKDCGMKFCVTAPLLGASGVRMGSIFLMDNAPRRSFGINDCKPISVAALRLIDLGTKEQSMESD